MKTKSLRNKFYKAVIGRSGGLPYLEGVYHDEDAKRAIVTDGSIIAFSKEGYNPHFAGKIFDPVNNEEIRGLDFPPWRKVMLDWTQVRSGQMALKRFEQISTEITLTEKQRILCTPVTSQSQGTLFVTPRTEGEPWQFTAMPVTRTTLLGRNRPRECSGAYNIKFFQGLPIKGPCKMIIGRYKGSESGTFLIIEYSEDQRPGEESEPIIKEGVLMLGLDF